MLAQHYAERSTGFRNSGGFQRGEEELFLLAVVAFVGEDLDEFQHLAEMLRIDLLAIADPTQEFIENREDQHYRFMLVPQLLRRRHMRLLKKQEVCQAVESDSAFKDVFILQV